MRVCWFCQQVNGDTAETCGKCGNDISRQPPLPATAHPARPLPDVVGRRNRSYRLLLVLLPFALALTLWFWLSFIPSVFQDAEEMRQSQLRDSQARITQALQACLRDTGGAPLRLDVLQQFTVTAADLTAGANPTGWKGPYLPIGQFPPNPFRPTDGSAGWRYTTAGNRGTVTPAHISLP